MKTDETESRLAVMGRSARNNAGVDGKWLVALARGGLTALFSNF
jgi:hypothetical protein